MTWQLGVVVAALLLGGCAADAAKVEQEQGEGVLIGRITSRTRTVEIRAGGPDGVRYTSRGSRNELKAEAVTLEELRRRDPAAAWFAETGWAAQDHVVWASEQ